MFMFSRDDQAFALVLCLLVAGLFWFSRVMYVVRKVWEAFNIRRFYIDYLKITDVSESVLYELRQVY